MQSSNFVEARVKIKNNIPTIGVSFIVYFTLSSFAQIDFLETSRKVKTDNEPYIFTGFIDDVF